MDAPCTKLASLAAGLETLLDKIADLHLLLMRKAAEDHRLEAGVGVLGDGVQPPAS